MIYPAGIDASSLAAAVASAQAMLVRIQASAADAPPDQTVASALGAVDPGAAVKFQMAWSAILAVLRANGRDADGAPLENNAANAQVAIGEGLAGLGAIPGGPGVDVNPPGGTSPWLIAGLVAGGLAAVAGGVWWWKHRD